MTMTPSQAAAADADDFLLNLSSKGVSDGGNRHGHEMEKKRHRHRRHHDQQQQQQQQGASRFEQWDWKKVIFISCSCRCLLFAAMFRAFEQSLKIILAVQMRS